MPAARVSGDAVEWFIDTAAAGEESRLEPVVWLAVAVAAVGAWLVGWPVWSRAERFERDTNTERYLAWRGRARERPATSEGWTAEERRRLLAAGCSG